MTTNLSAEKLLIKPGEGQDIKGTIIKVRAGDLGNDFSIMEAQIDPKQLLAPHMHDHEDQAVFVITGELEFEVGGEDGLRFTAGAGSYVIKPRGVSHCFWNLKSETARYIELSGRSNFEDFVEDSEDDPSLVTTIKAKPKYGITFFPYRIPKLLKDNGLTSVVGVGD
ncbi:MAG: cupin domain-containing protein [Myxococcales bacterium]|nr:cupin domain-containing protein [Myxococcales bacterium]